MKEFELLYLLLAVVVSFGVVNGNFRAERPNIDEQPNLVHLVDCSGQTITYNGSTIASNPFTVNNSNDGVYKCVNTGESVTVIRKSAFCCCCYYYIFSLFQLYQDPQLIRIVLLLGDRMRF